MPQAIELYVRVGYVSVKGVVLSPHSLKDVGAPHPEIVYPISKFELFQFTAVRVGVAGGSSSQELPFHV